MAKLTREGQLHFCNLITSIVDEMAIKQQILSRKNVTPVLFYFTSLAKDEEVGKWLADCRGELKESNWLIALNILISEDIFIVGKKSLLADYLMKQQMLHAYSDSRNVQAALCRHPDPTIKKLLIKYYQQFFC